MFDFFLDPALTTNAGRLLMPAMTSALPGAMAVTKAYFGSRDKGALLRAPGNGEILIFLDDGASGLPLERFRLARSEAELSEASPGGALVIGSSLPGGADNAISLWIGLDADGVLPGEYKGVRLVTSEVMVT